MPVLFCPSQRTKRATSKLNVGGRACRFQTASRQTQGWQWLISSKEASGQLGAGDWRTLKAFSVSVAPQVPSPTFHSTNTKPRGTQCLQYLATLRIILTSVKSNLNIKINSNSNIEKTQKTTIIGKAQNCRGWGKEPSSVSCTMWNMPGYCLRKLSSQ